MDDIDMKLWTECLHDVELQSAQSVLMRKSKQWMMTDATVTPTKNQMTASGLRTVLKILRAVQEPLIEIVSQYIGIGDKQQSFKWFLADVLVYAEAVMTCVEHNHMPGSTLHTMLHWQFLALSALTLVELYSSDLKKERHDDDAKLQRHRAASFDRFCMACRCIQKHPGLYKQNAMQTLTSDLTVILQASIQRIVGSEDNH
jgi:hypothetical protein